MIYSCPYCNAIVEVVADLNAGKPIPEEGDYLFCDKCQSICAFVLTLRTVTNEEEQKIREAFTARGITSKYN